MNIRSFLQTKPQLGERVYVDETAAVIGDVHLADDVAVWPTAVVRGDVNKIRIGKRSNIQDGSVLHVNHDSTFNPGGDTLIVGEEVTIGHRVVLHGCSIGDQCLIGINSVVLDKAIIPSQVLVGANSLVPPNKKLASGYLYVGSPVKQMRKLTDEEIAFFTYSATHYVALKDQYLTDLR